MRKNILAISVLNLIMLNSFTVMAQESTGPIFDEAPPVAKTQAAAPKAEVAEPEVVEAEEKVTSVNEDAVGPKISEIDVEKKEIDTKELDHMENVKSAKEKAHAVMEQESKQNVEDLKVAEPKKVEVNVIREEERTDKKEIVPAATNTNSNKTHIVKEEVYVVREVNKAPEAAKPTTQTIIITQEKKKKIEKNSSASGLKIEGGYINTKWNRLESNLTRGSIIGGFNYEFSLNNRFSLAPGFSLNMPKENNKFHMQNIRMMEGRIDAIFKYPLFNGFSFNSGFGLSVADYNIMKLMVVDGTDNTYKKFASGTAYGVSPFMGFRVKVLTDLSLDINARYFWYYSKLHKDIGGLAVLPALMFEF